MTPGDADRYERQPLLALLESYVLDVLGELSAEEVEETACAAEELLGDGDDWRSAVRRRAGWTRLVDARIADGWHRFRRGAGGEGADPAEFARRFADEAQRLGRS